MKLFLSIILISIALLACFTEDVYLYFRPPQPDQTVYIALRTQRSFSFDQEKTWDLNRKKALAQYVPVYHYRPARIESSKQRFVEFITALTSHQEKKQNSTEDLRNYLQKELGIQLTASNVGSILKYRDLKNLLEGILTVEESILQNKILDDPQPLMGKETIEVQSPNSTGATTYSVGEMITLEKARFLLEEKVRQLFWQVDKQVLDPVLQAALATLQANVEYDQLENKLRLDNIAREFPSQTVTYRPGDVLVPFRKLLAEKDVLLLNAYQQQAVADRYREFPWRLFTVLILVVFYNLFLSKVVAPGTRNIPPYRFLLSLLILTIIILKAFLVLTWFPIYILPFYILPMLIIWLNHGKIAATGTVLVGAMLTTFISAPSYPILIFFTFGGLTAVLVSSGLKKRLQIVIPSLLVGCMNVLTLIVFGMDWQVAVTQILRLPEFELSVLPDMLHSALLPNLGWAFIGGLLSGPLALLLLPLLELSWRTASTFKLNRYMDLHRPLMRELLSKAPGTYQHSMTTAYLAQSVGEAIGANTQLLRIGAYYHDIGKMMNPKYFIENQFNGENPHDLMDPRDSAKLIVDHARQGMKIGQEAGLPKVIVDLIVQHHGTQLMEYFYNAAAKQNPRSPISEEDFRYPGPKPQSVEAAILMVVDAIEAASRSLQDTSRKSFEKIVRLILVKRLVDGQFSECDVTSRDLNKIIRTLVDALEASFHSRIRYPWQEKKRPAFKRTTWTIGSADVRDPEDRAFRL
jgi:putative nucleotidyltransferase with HDIG domain